MNAQKLFASACLLLMMVLRVQGQETKDPGQLLAKAQPVASKSLAQFRQLITEQNYERMGFKSMQEVQSSSLGSPLQVFKVRLDELQKYTTDTNPDKLIHGGDEFLYPVLFENQVRSSVLVADVAGTWKAVSFGKSDSTKVITTVRDRALPQGAAVTSRFLVQIPALNLSFIAYRAAEKLMLTPLFDDSRFNFKVEQSLPADEVFKRILPAAKEHSGLPS
ncbi:MAG: hypothetical protein LAO23_11695 [Acidobacteriia bacterium]|nr:hypothetical protein [Terriglobia bacterium]